MDILRSISTKTEFADLQLLIPFSKQYDLPGAFAPAAKDFEVLIAASNRITELFHDNIDTLLIDSITSSTLSSIYAFIKTLKIFSRCGPQALLLAYHKDIFPQIIKLYGFAVRQYDQLVVQSSSDDDSNLTNIDFLSKPALFLVLRVEIARLLQNMTIQNREVMKENILSTESLVNEVLHIIQHGYYGDNETMNTALLEAMLKAADASTQPELHYYTSQLNYPTITGLTDLGHLLRAVCYIVSEDHKNDFAQHGLIAALYSVFLEVTSTQINLADSTLAPLPFSLEIDAFNPFLMQSEQPYTLTNLLSFDASLLSHKTAPEDQMWYAIRMSFNDISRILIIFGALDDDEKYMEHFASRCFGSRAHRVISKGKGGKSRSIVANTNVGPQIDDKQQNKAEVQEANDQSVNTQANLAVQHDITLFQRFIERVFYILGSGVLDNQVPSQIATPISKIVSTQSLLDNYVVKETNVGYHPHQQSIIEHFNKYCAEAQKATTNNLIEPYNPVSPTIYTDNTSMLYVKMCYVKVLNYVPLTYAPFLYLHKYFLSFVWNLFSETINTLVPPSVKNPDGTTPSLSHIPADFQNVEIIPSLVILLRILESSYSIETAAQATMTQEQAVFYYQLGLTPLAETVKTLIFGKYANFDTDSAHRDVVLAQMVKEDEDERAELAKIVCPDDCECKQPPTDDESEDSVGCDDFEAFSENPNPKEEDKKNNQTARDFLNGSAQWKRCPKIQLGPSPNTSMIPAGGLTQSLFDDQDNTTLKARLILLMLSPSNHNITSLIQEILYAVSYKKSDEFIRLVGFGRAVGLLANKGLPGFSHLTQNALNLDDILKMKKKMQDE